MAIEKKEVEHVARLARLFLTEDEKNNFTEQLSKILNHVDRLKSLDTAQIAAMAQPFFEGTRWRQDAAVPGFSGEDILKQAPDKEENYFKVPKVID